VDPEGEVLDAAINFFGAGDPRIGTVRGCGIEFVRRPEGRGTVDVLIIDAEDGTAPPESMRGIDFWEGAAPALAPCAVVAANCIGEEDEKEALTEVVTAALPGHTVWTVAVPPEADVSRRHSLLFATPRGCRVGSLGDALGEGSYVTDGKAWLDAVGRATGGAS